MSCPNAIANVLTPIVSRITNATVVMSCPNAIADIARVIPIKASPSIIVLPGEYDIGIEFPDALEVEASVVMPDSLYEPDTILPEAVETEAVILASGNYDITKTLNGGTIFR
jgi:hypothetical protein